MTVPDYAGRDNNPVKIQCFDDERRTTTVVNASANINLNHPDVSTDVLNDLIFNKSRYHYDSLNRWVKLEMFNLVGMDDEGIDGLSINGQVMLLGMEGLMLLLEFGQYNNGFMGETAVANPLEQGYITLGGWVGKAVAGELGKEIGSQIGRGLYVVVDLGICITGTMQGIKTVNQAYQAGRRGYLINNIRFNMKTDVGRLMFGPGSFQLGSSLVGLANDIPSYMFTIEAMKNLW